MKGLQGERLRQAFKYLDADQDGFIKPVQFKQIILVRGHIISIRMGNSCHHQEIAGHKLSDAVVDRLPTLCTLTQGGRISYSEVVAFHNVVRGGCHPCVFAKHLRRRMGCQKWTWLNGACSY